MKSPSTFVSVCALAALVTGMASAKEPQSTQQGAGAAQLSGNQGRTWQKAESQEFFRASDLIGKKAQSSDNQKVGSVKDVAFNQQGEIFALVDIGSGKLAVLPWQAVNAASAKGDQNLVLNSTQQELQSGPAVTKDQWGALNNPQFTQGVYSYYHLQAPAAMGGASTPSGQEKGSSQLLK